MVPLASQVDQLTRTMFKDPSISFIAVSAGCSSGAAKSVGKISSLGEMDLTRKVRVAGDGRSRK